MYEGVCTPPPPNRKEQGDHNELRASICWMLLAKIPYRDIACRLTGFNLLVFYFTLSLKLNMLIVGAVG